MAMTPVLLNQPPGAFSFYSQRTTGFTVSATQLGTVFDCSGTSFAVTAAPSLGAGFQFEVYASGSNTYTVTASSGTIQGPAGSATTLALTTGQGAVFESDGTNWKVVSAVGLGSTSGSAIIVKDNAFTVIGDVDATKKFVFQVDTQATASTMTYDVGAQTAGRTVSVPVLTASGSFAFQNFLNVFTAQQTIDISGTAGTLPAQIFPSGTPQVFIGAVTNILEGVAWAGQGFRLAGRLAGGSRGADAATANGATMLTLQAFGYDGTSWTTTPNASYSQPADGVWSGSNRGAYHVWSGTINGATSLGEFMRAQGGNLLIGTTTNISGTGGLKVAGTTASSSTTTGALQVGGGAGIVGAVQAGDNSGYSTSHAFNGDTTFLRNSTNILTLQNEQATAIGNQARILVNARTSTGILGNFGAFGVTVTDNTNATPSGAVTFSTNNAGSGVGERARVSPLGNFLIGTTSDIAGSGGLCVNSATMLSTKTAFTNGAAAAAGTLGNAPVAGNPTKWIPINDNGTTRYIPAW